MYVKRIDIEIKHRTWYYVAMYNGVILLTSDTYRECETELNSLSDDELNRLYNKNKM